ncbi:MAG: hypothetical protein GKR89_31350 [Candidatus Latescibacteria bacterium]|nr:hypothetical protein [Candidatus Latescibacterota bacterium]
MSTAPLARQARYQYWPPLVYPLAIIACLGLFYFLRSAGLPLLFCSYIPLILGAATIVFFEYYTPHHKNWMPGRKEVWNDALFMVCVQMVLPKILAFLTALVLAKTLGQAGLQLPGLWPHHWPVAAQALTMVLVADLLRYWLHRFSHQYTGLWRLHAVHHAPQKLYWFNVGRFHPLEKALQFQLDALPFILLGVGAETLALYFVFYAVNGFFQHCNIELRLGPLNYIISGPQLHRWHHSRIAAESNANYGNNLIVWDLLFGTYFYPRDRQVKELGLVNKDYPQDFATQLKAPFSGRLDTQALPLQSIGDIALGLLLKCKMHWIGATRYRPLVKAAQDPDRAQAQVLRSIMTANQHSQYGLEHGFAQIADHDSYKRRVPVCQYEDLRPYIDRQDGERVTALTSQPPCMYNQTSGTTGAPKYIPVLEQTLRDLRRSQQIFSYVQYRARPQAFHGKIVGLVSPAIEGHRTSGTPYGSASGHIYENMPRLARAKYVLPKEVFAIADYDIKYYIIARLAVEREDITYLGSANPSTFHRLLETIEAHRTSIVADIEQGRCQYLDQLDPPTAAALRPLMSPNPHRARVLETLLTTPGPVDFTAFWPYLKLLATWTGGSCAVSLNSILPRFPGGIKLVELGYLASEMRGTITIDAHTNEGIPAIQENFYEFVERDKWEQGEREFLGVGGLEVGLEYYIFATTPAGLYRYHMNDIVTVTGFFANTPTIRFVQKGKGVTNITGEKLYESQVIDAVDTLARAFGLDLRFYQMLASRRRNRYQLYLEINSGAGIDIQTTADSLDQQLCQINVEYKAKRASKRLQAPIVQLLAKGTYEAYKKHGLAKGQPEGQYKNILLQYDEDFDFDLGQKTQNPV